KGFNKNLIINNFTPFFIVGLKILFTKPKSLIRLIKNLTKNIDGDYAELFSIAVDPRKQGLGIGKLLLKDVEKKALEKGCQRITLTTDFFNNTEVINFYLKMGYAVYYDFIAYPHRRMYKMIKIIN
ncbi:GNAT family N-acetyltransferase, partial [Bacteroidota bacterium]